MAIVKKREIDVLLKMDEDEIELFLEKLPADKEKLEGMFDFVDMKLETNSCDHSSRWAMQYMMQNGMNFSRAVCMC